MYIAPGQGQTTPSGQNIDVTSFKKISLKSDFIHILMILYMSVVPRQGQTTTWGQKFDANRKALSLCLSFAASVKKNLFCHFFF